MSKDNKIESKSEDKSLSFTKDELSKLITEVATNAAMAAQVANTNPVAQVARSHAPNHGRRCQECGQYSKACGGKHAQMIVFPKGKAAQKYFQGVFINGVRYDSGNASRKITVPAQNDITKILELMEDQEEQFRIGRSGNHNSGSIGGKSATGYRPADGRGWR